MNQDEIKGKAKDVAGRAQRQVGEWTGDEEAQAEGTAQQGEGKLQNTWGKAKKEGQELIDDVRDRDKKDRGAA